MGHYSQARPNPANLSTYPTGTRRICKVNKSDNAEYVAPEEEWAVRSSIWRDVSDTRKIVPSRGRGTRAPEQCGSFEADSRGDTPGGRQTRRRAVCVCVAEWAAVHESGVFRVSPSYSVGAPARPRNRRNCSALPIAQPIRSGTGLQRGPHEPI